MVRQLDFNSRGVDAQVNAAVQFDATLQHAPAVNTAAVVTIAADPLRPTILDQIFFSYSAAPTGGSIKVEDGVGTVVWGPFAVTSAGLQSVTFSPPLCGSANTALVVTLAAAVVTGVLAVNARQDL